MDLAPRIIVSYPNLNHDAELIFIKTDKDYNIIDTLSVDQLNNVNDYTMRLDLRSPEDYNYIISTDSMNYVDTISEFNYETKGFNCNARLDNITYYLNGELREETDIEIQ